ncbi:MAG TPA: hypothetical protein DDZ80_20725 [Cyanobacteria bacterium UBA8803]|nr:hypothetical protein [Cyanobacteria bacterium UBA8803]
MGYFLYYQLPITNYQLPITNYQLPITHYKYLLINLIISSYSNSSASSQTMVAKGVYSGFNCWSRMMPCSTPETSPISAA